MEAVEADGRRTADEHPITPAEAIRFGATMTAHGGSDTPRLDAEVLLRHVLQTDRADLFARLTDPLPPASAAAFLTLLGRRIAGEPIAYLVGEKEFMGLPIQVGPGVLVPRPETELLVEWALRWLSDRPDAVVVDVGTGSGAIALAVAAGLPPGSRARIIAADESAEALAWAARNRWALALDTVELVRGDLTTWLAPATADLVLANLPYLTPDQIAENPLLAAEPEGALLGGADGLDLIRRLVADLPRVLAPGGAIGLELDPGQTAQVTALLAETLPGLRIETIADLAGLLRHVVAERP
ncbi:MAG: Peptide chain release factor N(5)-glutamine methyltransferase [uncultured Thermomicrobiales bacterium]|uniref:Release factor glutamine methyltransferase n=1 Tax=uncultured Thermomicrobiales bacterium TaxID=1645740 RepID=A0A6J4VJ76_9BACT|nr:MAG: Peptide chain release factor N(5)-glutamine methyltransferase [uncultured Thermomicrobiales bacterium]